jgi:hypothetical protein
MGLLLRLDNTGWVMLTSDALYSHASYGPPATGTPITWETDKWRSSVETIRKLALENEAFIFRSTTRLASSSSLTTARCARSSSGPVTSTSDRQDVRVTVKT